MSYRTGLGRTVIPYLRTCRTNLVPLPSDARSSILTIETSCSLDGLSSSSIHFCSSFPGVVVLSASFYSEVGHYLVYATAVERSI